MWLRSLRNSSVGSLDSDRLCRLDATADRIVTLAYQRIESLQEPTAPSLTEIGTDLSRQGPQPVALPGSRTTRRPSPLFESEGDTGPDGFNRSLKPFHIPRRSRPKDTPALRATPPPQNDLVRKTVKESGNKSMTPNPMPLTPRAHLWSRPLKIPPLRDYLLDGNQNEDYHQNILL